MQWFWHIYYTLSERFGFDPDPSDDRNIDRNDRSKFNK